MRGGGGDTHPTVYRSDGGFVDALVGGTRSRVVPWRSTWWRPAGVPAGTLASAAPWSWSSDEMWRKENCPSVNNGWGTFFSFPSVWTHVEYCYNYKMLLEFLYTQTDVGDYDW